MNKLIQTLAMYKIDLNSDFRTQNIKLEHRDCSIRITEENFDILGRQIVTEADSKLFKFDFIDNSLGNKSLFSIHFTSDFDYIEGWASDNNMDEKEFFEEVSEYFEIIEQEFDGA